ncbi:MAG: hypothetical protein AAGM67_01830, partial [Bacteroidota bacterium]
LEGGLSSFQETIKEAYLAPEIVAKEGASPASAIFALGICLYELAGGGLAYGLEGGRRAAKVQANLPPIPNLSARFNQLLQLMLARKSDRRPKADTLQRLASTFLREKQWKSVGGLSFAPDVSGIPLNQEQKQPLPETPALTAPMKPEPSLPPSPPAPKPTPKDEPMRSPKESLSTPPRSSNSNERRKQIPILMLSLLLLVFVGGYWYFSTDEPTKPQTSHTTLEGAESIAELMILRARFNNLIQEMSQNPNLPPTEKTFLRLAQMQYRNLEDGLREHFTMEDDRVLAWKAKADMGWLRQTRSQLERNLQNLELLQ